MSLLAAQDLSVGPIDNTRLVVSTRTENQATLQEIRERLGVLEVDETSVGQQIWTLPEDRVLNAFRVLQASKAIEAVDYSGDDFRTLLLGVPDGLLDDVERSQVAALQALPGVTSVTVQRSRQGGLSSQILETPFGQTDGLPTDGGFLLDLPGQGRMLATGASVRLRDRATSWSGSISLATPAGSEPLEGDASFTESRDRIRGSITIGEDGYLILPVGRRGLQLVARLDAAALPDDHADGGYGGAMASEFSSVVDPPSSTRAVQPVISIGVVWTQGAENQALGLGSDIREGIEGMIADANAALVRSGGTFRVELAGSKRISGQEGASMETDVIALTGRGDGRWDEVHAWRNQVKADVIMLVRTDAKECGWAGAINAGADQAFGVLSYFCGVFTYTLSHELGHLLGARHRNDDRPEVPTPMYARGYVQPGEWRTIMADRNDCLTCGRLNHWANPDVRVRGVPSGIANRFDDLRVINANAARIAAYR